MMTYRYGQWLIGVIFVIFSCNQQTLNDRSATSAETETSDSSADANNKHWGGGYIFGFGLTKENLGKTELSLAAKLAPCRESRTNDPIQCCYAYCANRSDKSSCQTNHTCEELWVNHCQESPLDSRCTDKSIQPKAANESFKLAQTESTDAPIEPTTPPYSCKDQCAIDQSQCLDGVEDAMDDCEQNRGCDDIYRSCDAMAPAQRAICLDNNWHPCIDSCSAETGKDDCFKDAVCCQYTCDGKECSFSPSPTPTFVPTFDPEPSVPPFSCKDQCSVEEDECITDTKPDMDACQDAFCDSIWDTCDAMDPAARTLCLNDHWHPCIDSCEDKSGKDDCFAESVCCEYRCDGKQCISDPSPQPTASETSSPYPTVSVTPSPPIGPTASSEPGPGSSEMPSLSPSPCSEGESYCGDLPDGRGSMCCPPDQQCKPSPSMESGWCERTD